MDDGAPDELLEPYERLLELARTAETLVADDRYDELARVFAERDLIVAQLPARPPFGAADVLHELSRIIRTTELMLRTGIEASQRSLVALDSGRRAVAGYAGSPTTSVLDASV